MPKLKDIRNDIKNLQNQFKPLTQLDNEFDVDESVNFPIDSKSNEFWRSIKIDLYGYIYKVGDEANADDGDTNDGDEPEFISISRRDSDTKIVHTPEGTLDPPKLKPLVKKIPVRTIQAFNALDDGKSHEITVTCSAFDSDSNSAWEAVVDAAGKDLKTIGASTLDNASGFVTPGKLADFIGTELAEGLTDSPEMIGGEEVVVDKSTIWGRPKDLSEWSCYKWVVFRRDNQDAYYLVLFRISLSAIPVDWTLSYASIFDEVPFGSTELATAVLRVKSGETIESVTENLGVDANQIQLAMIQLYSADNSTLNTVSRNAFSAEINSLRKQVSQLKQALVTGVNASV